MSQASLGKIFETPISREAVAQWESNTNSPTSDKIGPIATRANVRAEWLWSGEGLPAPEADEDEPPRELPEPVSRDGIVSIGEHEYTVIPRFDASLSAGPGSIIDPNAEPLGYHLIERQWLRLATTAAPEHLALLRVDGDSMVPTLADGDWVLVDRTQCRVSREGIYALQVGENAWVKRISVNLREKLIRIISDNQVVPMQEVDEADLTLIGKVVLIVGRRVS